MAFANRQFEEIVGFIEVSITGAVAPGAITNGSVAQSSQACTLQGTTNAATFALGDNLEVIAPAAAALNGVEVKAFPGTTPGTCNLVFVNNTGGTVTPVSSTYRIIAKRYRNDLI